MSILFILVKFAFIFSNAYFLQLLLMNIRQVNLKDAEQIAEIYNFYVLNTHHTFETEAITADEMQKRIGEISNHYPFLIAETDGDVFGYAYAALYKPRQAYRFSVEVSVYVRANFKQKGIGKMLYAKLFEELAEMKVHAVIAGIALPNEASIKLHENFGFEKIAHFREVGFKFGKWIDVAYWERKNEGKKG